MYVMHGQAVLTSSRKSFTVNVLTGMHVQQRRIAEPLKRRVVNIVSRNNL